MARRHASSAGKPNARPASAKAATWPTTEIAQPPDGTAERRRITALELAIRAAPYLLPTNLDRITGAQLTAEAEKIEAWLKEAK